ncbi:ubinuclein-1 isoform X1 [Schistocerca serialis cubense]|uniref:ubinuclein-1 isoform X1 n=1 Tax=Schistocerca serialis cubense TaxID=2023355 RepID=UPI00214F49EB|nr:ubinuclein-1 isoform X1 [Schistocerca serialis cubense]
MSEQKQGTLTSIGTNKKEKKVKEVSKTVRFTITLGESTEEACPEFNYRDLLRSAEKKRKTKLKSDYQVNGTSPFPDNDDDEEELKQLARKYEEKYGVGRKKHGRYVDYVDLGAGYDETDPFIDNTDAYDEVVPEEMTTAHGGFYINCGPLEFKEVSDQSDVEESKDIKNKKRVKRALALPDDVGSEEDTESDAVKAPSLVSPLKKPKLMVGKSDLLKKQKYASHDRDILKKKRKRAIDLIKRKSPTVKELLKEKREYLEPTVPPVPEPETEPKPTVPEIKKAESRNVIVDSKQLVVEPKKPSVLPAPKVQSNTITDVIESVVSAARGDDEVSKDSASSVSRSASASVMSSDSDASQDVEADLACAETDIIDKDKEEQKEKTEEKLPENLSEDMKELIEDLKIAALTADGKCKFFSAEVNQMVLSLEYKCQQLPCNIRHQVYSHLATSLPCTKETLMKRAKKLRLQAEEDKMKLPLRRLKNAIDKIMPIALEAFTKECQKLGAESGVESIQTKSSDSEEEETDTKPTRIPKRRFPWTDELRFNLCEVVRIKLQCIELQKPRKESVAEIIRNFLEEKVKPLWPPGWMKISILQRECKEVYSSPQLKKKKAVALPRKIPYPSTGNQTQPTPSYHNTNGGSASVSTGLKIVKNVGQTSGNPNSGPTVRPQAGAVVKMKSELNTAMFHHGTAGNVVPRPKNTPALPNPAANQTLTNPTSVLSVNSTSSGSSIRSASQASSGNKVGVPHLLSSSPVKVKGGSDVFMRQNVSGKKSPTCTPERLSPSVSVASVVQCKTKGGVDIVPSKGLDLTISGGGKQSLPSVSSSTGKINSEISIIPVTVSSQTVVSQKSPALSLANLPDCISVTPAISSSVQSSNTIGNTKAVISLKQRILQDATKERTRSPINVGNLTLPGNLEEEGIEVIEIINDNSIAYDNQKSENFRSDDMRNITHTKMKTEIRKRKKGIPKELPSASLEPIHSAAELKSQASKIFTKNSDKQLCEESAAAADIINQMISDSPVNTSNQSTKELHSIEGKHLGVTPSADGFTLSQASKRELDTNVQDKEETDMEIKRSNDGDKKLDDAIVNSESKQSAADIEIGKEISRVMKSIVELQNMSGEDTSQTAEKYTQPRNSAVSVHPVSNTKSSHLKTVVESEDANIVSARSSPKSSSEFGKTNILFSGFQEEFQKHIFRDSTMAEIETLNFKTGKGAITISPIPQQGSTAMKHSSLTVEGSQSRLSSAPSRNRSAVTSGSHSTKPISNNPETYSESSFPGRQSSSTVSGYQDVKTTLSSQTGATQHSPSYL